MITAESIFNTNPGWIANGRFRTTDTHNYGVLDTTGVLRKSSNVGAALISRRLGNQQFYDFVRRFGYGQRTGSGFPGESAGVFGVGVDSHIVAAALKAVLSALNRQLRAGR